MTASDVLDAGTPSATRALGDLPKNRRARIVAIHTSDDALEATLREIGFAEGDEVEILHYGPLGRKPLCVRLNETLVALRPTEAAAIRVETIA